MTRAPRISVVVISRDEGAELRRTVENLDDTLPDRAEIVVVDDGSTDRSADRVVRKRGRVKLVRMRGLGVARARNFGARQSRGEIIVFADAHIRVEKLWWRPLAEILEDPKIGGAAGAVTHLPLSRRRVPAPNRGRQAAVGCGLKFKGPDLDVVWLPKRSDVPYPAPILPGCCMAMRRDVFETAGGWDEGTFQRGCVDNEGCVRLWLFGFDLVVAPEIVVRHRFREKSPYPVGWPEYLNNRLRLAFAHLNPQRLGKVVAAQRRRPGFGEALLLVMEGGIAARRREMMARHVRDDDWYFERFGMKW